MEFRRVLFRSAGLAAQVADCTCDDELVQSAIEAGRKLRNGIGVLVTHRDEVFAVPDGLDDGRAADLIEEHLVGSEVRVRRIKAVDEVTRERSEEHTSELQSLMRISYAVFCLKKKKTKTQRGYERR